MASDSMGRESGARSPGPPSAARLLLPSGGLGPPSSGQLLLPSGKLLASAVAPAGAAVASDGQELERFRHGAEKLGKRVQQMIEEKGPGFQQIVQQVSAETGQTARVTIGAVAAHYRASANVPGRRRTYFLLAGLAGLVLCLLAYWIAAQQATAAARVQVADALDRFGLRGMVLYDTLTATPFGSVTLHGVSLRLGPLLVPATSLEISGISTSQDRFTGGTFALQGARLPMVAIVRNEELPWAGQLLGLGFVNPSVDATARIRIDDSAQTADVSLQLSSGAMGSARLSGTLGGLGSTQTEGLLAGLGQAISGQEQNAYGTFDLMTQEAALLSAISWKGGSLELDDAPLHQRAAAIPATAVPEEAPAGDEASAAPFPFAQFMPPDQAEQAQATLAHWMSQGGTLVVKSAPEVPVPLFRGYGSDMAPTWDDAQTLAQAGISVGD